MLTFRNTNIVFALVLLALLARDWSGHTPWWAYAVVVFVYSWVVFYGVYFIQSGFFMPTIWRAPRPLRAIALSFDDGPSADYTPQVLDILREQGVKAAFFCIGKNIAGNEALLARIHREGHLIGNHSFSHSVWFDLYSSSKMLADVQAADRAVESVTGKRPLFFRPPFGVINPMLRDAIRQSGHRVIGWSLRSYDTVINDKHTLMTRLLRLLQPGSIVLLHDHGKQTLDVLPDFIRAAREQGYEFQALDQLIASQPYE